ncbi:MAG: glycosyltransferase [Candidatus Pelagibacter sp.]
MNEITVVIITYKSENIIYEFIKKIPKTIKVIIIDNSQNYELKKNIEKEHKNISLFLKENNGVSSALNFAVDKIQTKYFLQISPDIEFNFNDLNFFIELAKEKKDNFAAIGPRFTDVNEKSHKQISEKIEFGQIESVHGSCMFINKDSFLNIGKFDENFFLYFEETEFCYRAKKKGYLSYQINRSRVKSKGRSVDTNIENKEYFSNVLIWHFIWSKYYFTRKKYGKLISVFLFTPLIFRILIKILLYKVSKNEKLLDKYKYRFDGLFKSIRGKKSNLRP